MVPRPTARRTAALAVIACCLAAAPSQGAELVQFADGIDPAGQLRAIAPAPDGSMWFTFMQDASRLGRITPDGTATSLTTLVPAGSAPYELAADDTGNMWVTLSGTGRLARVSPAGATTEFWSPLPSTSAPKGITAGPDGNMWFTLTGNGGGVGRITPAGVIAVYTAGLTANGQPTDITAGPDGNLWVTVKFGPAIAKVTPGGVITEYSGGLVAGNEPEQIVAGPDGNVWATLQGDPGAIARITPSGVITTFSAGLPANAKPTGITPGADGALWFTVRDAEQVGRITTDGTITMHAPALTPGFKPNGMARDAQGNVWFVGRDYPSRIGRLGMVAPAIQAGTVTPGSASADLRVPVNPNGQTTGYTVDYGTTPAFGATLTGSIPPTSSATRTTTITLTGLPPETAHHYRVTVTNAVGTAVGPAGTFTTLPTPRPRIGRAVVATAVSGTVMVRFPGTAADVPLPADRPLPLGTTIDTTRGRVRMVSALPGGRTQSAEFWSGRFAVRQSRATGMVDVILDRRPLRGCPVAARPAALPWAPLASPTPWAAAQARRRPPRRTLWAQDDGGRYRTHGHNSVATVRGTRWATIETCAGTTTAVAEGAVSVRALRTGRVRLVRAGERLLVRRP